VIVVDDGSSDQTRKVAELAGAEVLALEKNGGKAQAVFAGLDKARSEGCTAAVIIDGDGQHQTRDIPQVMSPVLNGKADLVIGSRFLSQNNDVPIYRRLGQKTLDVFTGFGCGQRVTDSQSGFRAFSLKALDNMDFKSNGYGIESDMIAHFAKRGLAICEVPISVRYDVPHKHKKNPLSHGFSVLGSIINLISYRRPLLAFGVPGAVLFIIGLVTSSLAFTDYYSTTKFPFTLSMLSVSLLILGMLFVIAGLILNALVGIFEKGTIQAADP
jgi:glycosyltransferase involved in cell wall biosynthesis